MYNRVSHGTAPPTAVSGLKEAQMYDKVKCSLRKHSKDVWLYVDETPIHQNLELERRNDLNVPSAHSRARQHIDERNAMATKQKKHSSENKV